MSKRGQGLSITTIIVAAIALIVLVVLVAIFTGRLGGFNRGLQTIGDATQTCGSQDGDLKPACVDREVSIASSNAAAQGLLCCKVPQTP